MQRRGRLGVSDKQLLTIQLFGEFRLLAGDKPVTAINTARLQSLLAYLLLHRAAPQARQQLAFRFWPDSNDAQARTNLRNALHQLRNTLPDADRFLQTDAKSIQWRPDAPFSLDVAEFEQHLQTAQKADNSTVVRKALEQAIRLYQGNLLPGCYDDWIMPERERWQQTYASTLEQLITWLESERDYPAAINYAQCLLQHDPLREATYGRLMQLYATAGDRAAALRVYHTCTTALLNELGVEPSPTTHTIYEHLLHLESPAPAAAVRSTTTLIGRTQAWAQLQEAWRKAQRGQPSFALVRGEAGIGKTRLVEELVEWANRQGIATATATCYAVGGRLAYAPVQEWLRAPTFRRTVQTLDKLWLGEVARLAPELWIDQPQTAAPAPLTEAWQRQRLFEALARFIFQRSDPLLLVLDDVQWCDIDTLEWLHFLLRFNPKARLLIVATLRQEEITTEHALTPFLGHLRYANQLIEIELARLDPQETTRLATSLLGQEISPALAAHLYANTEGNPLFVVETVRAEAGRGVGEWGNGGVETTSPPPPLPPSVSAPLPGKVQAVIKARLDRLSPRAFDLACVAAVIGRAFVLDVLTQASDCDEDTLVRGLDELWQQQIIREQSDQRMGGVAGADIYDFSHDKLREVAYNSLSPIRRRHLHRRIAAALESLRASQLDSVSDQIATHYARAGQPAQAIVYYRRAAAVAHRLSALQVAIAHLNQALALLPLLPEGPERAGLELALQVAIGPLLLTTKGYAAPEVEQAFNRAWEICQQMGDIPQRFQVLWGLGRFYLVQPNLARGLEAGQQLLEIAQRAEEPSLLVEAYNSVGAYSFHRGALVAARRYLEEGIALYDRVEHRNHALIYGQDPGVVCLTRVAWTLWCLGYPDQAQARVQAALDLARDLAHPYSQVVALTYAAAHYQFSGQAAACRTQAEAAMMVAQQHGFTLWLLMATFLRGWARTWLGEMQAGLVEMEQYLALYRRSGAELGAAYYAALLADAQGRAGQPERGLATMAEAFSLLERTADRWCEAELHRLHGELLHQTGAHSAAAAAWQTAIQIARQQKAHLWELRTTVSLSRLWQAQGKGADARADLAAIYSWFQEGFATPDLQAARDLLTTLEKLPE